MEEAKSRLARVSGITMQERTSWGRKAMDSTPSDGEEGGKLEEGEEVKEEDEAAAEAR